MSGRLNEPDDTLGLDELASAISLPLGDELGVTYQEGEPLKAGEKEVGRDRHRWELDPASAEDYQERLRDTNAGPAEEILAMNHAHHQPHRRL